MSKGNIKYINIPAEVHAVLAEHHYIDHPFKNSTLDSVQNIGATNWNFSTTFEINESELKSNKILFLLAIPKLHIFNKMKRKSVFYKQIVPAVAFYLIYLSLNYFQVIYCPWWEMLIPLMIPILLFNTVNTSCA